MEKTPFSGLTILEPGEGLDSDNGAFIDRDRRTIDHFLQLGAKLHRHNGQVGLSNPTVPASGMVIASGGTIAPGLTISIGYTLEDSQGGETMIAPLAVVSTGSPMDIPIAAPSAAVNYEGGSLLVDSYYYAVTFTDGEGGETPAGPAVLAERAPGFASGRIILTNLTYGMATAGAVGWRLFRAKGGGTYDLLATGSSSEDEFVDDGSTSVNCDIHPPTDSQNTTRRINTLQVTLPPLDANMSRAAAINLYASISSDFSSSSLGQFPIASAGKSTTFSSLNFGDTSPPDVNLSVGGASLIDPDTELLDWPWRRAVATSAALGSGLLGWVKLAQDTGKLFAVLSPSASAAGPKEWTPVVTTPGRKWASASFGSLASGASGTLSFNASAAAIHILKVSTNKRARIRAYGDQIARAADAGRAIGVNPTGDHGVQLDYAATSKASGMVGRVTPIVDAANLDEPVASRIYLTADNFDATGNVVVAFLYIPIEIL